MMCSSWKASCVLFLSVIRSNPSASFLPTSHHISFLLSASKSWSFSPFATTATRNVHIERFRATTHDGGDGENNSVTGTVYETEQENAPSVTLFTKEGCTLCDKVKDVLVSIKDAHPHSLNQMDITDPDKSEWFEKYKYDIPVLHVNGMYWIKHRLTADEAIKGLTEAREGKFAEPRRGEPNAAKLERT